MKQTNLLRSSTFDFFSNSLFLNRDTSSGDSRTRAQPESSITLYIVERKLSCSIYLYHHPLHLLRLLTRALFIGHCHYSYIFIHVFLSQWWKWGWRSPRQGWKGGVQLGYSEPNSKYQFFYFQVHNNLTKTNIMHQQLQKICREKVCRLKKFFEQILEIQVKYPLHPQKLLAPTPVLWPTNLSSKLPAQTHQLHYLASTNSYSDTITTYRKTAVVL